MLIDVLTRVAADTGYNPDQQREILVRLLNVAAKELHSILECNAIKREVTLVITPDAVVTLPNFIGQLRGMRMHTNELPFDLHSIGQPRYTSTTLAFKFKNWRDLGEARTHTLPSSVGQLIISTARVEDNPVTLIISGKTNLANNVEERVLINAPEVLTANLFDTEINKIACLEQRTCDIVIKDSNGTEIATLYNNDNQTRYKLVDVSQIFWTLDTSAGESLIDVCYKLPLRQLLNDSDSFPAGDEYDNAWYHMTMHYFYKPINNKQDDSMTARSLALAACMSAKDGMEQEIVKKVEYGRNKFFGIFRKFRYFPGSVTNVDHNVQV